MPSRAWSTGISVVRESNSLSMLSCFGSMCWIRTNAIPVFVGRCERTCVNASIAPADAPIPTTGNTRLEGGRLDLRGFGGMVFFFIDPATHEHGAPEPPANVGRTLSSAPDPLVRLLPHPNRPTRGSAAGQGARPTTLHTGVRAPQR